ncbi:kinesin-like protein KIF20B isoform X1 [Corvus cornix cornix]|uniref:kinesin-like protein KIF20B isoform X1 n=1 Tax=Corvus cornix cornix TaxID=932674 RepID=UPI00194E5AB2|nr:kinesin-like protein KIF20B isoform X1 [Corvus cornix cornix]XP_020439409.2 kinesin-like protein KIF20B isoform X1 [Corvus cornix cornix]XP_020439410.2 kinesin-like protein KIF20B isoform X1 [Corvus cornix cornix]
MEPTLDNEKFYRPSYIASIEPSPRAGPVSVEDIKTDLSSEFSLVSSSSDTSQRSSLESKGHIQVCLRIRPFTSLERENGSQDCVSLEDSTNIVLKPPQHYLSRLSEKSAGQMLQKFTFSQVFGPETTQEEFFEGTMKQPVQDFLDGYNRLVFTYGVTNAGKTYTFQGTEDDVGILPRTMDMLFKSIQGKLYTAMDLKPYRCRDYIKLTENQMREETAIKNSLLRLIKEVDHQINTNNKAPMDSKDLEDISEDSEQSITTARNYIKFSVWVSFFEIYNECFYDLLIPISNDKKRKTLRLAQDIKGCSFLKDLQWVQVSDSKEAFRLLKLGLKHQSIASTKLNNCSSRSHSIFTVKVLKIEDSGTPRVTRVNELSLCDLAGSERYTKTRNEGDRLKESGNINTSLLTLGKCINALKNCQQSKLQQHIPFRESKLTHFLQGFFSGKGKVYMIVNISKCASAYEETLNVLKFSAIAQKVLVMDTSILPQDQSFGQKLAGESSLLNVTRMPIPRKRGTILWDRTLEDVFEDDDDEMEEQPSVSREEAVQENEGSEVVIAKEKYMMLVSLVQDLRSKLITEKKNKLLLEIKIREEVIQEFTQYFAEREIDFKECLSHERAQLEENSEKRLEIFKELVNSYTKSADEKSKLQDRPCSEQAGPLNEENSTDTGAYIDFEGVIDSLQNDITDIKNQAEAAHQYIVSLEDPQETIGCLEQQLAKLTAELVETKEELEKKTKGFETQRIKLDESAEQLKEATEKMNIQNERIQELIDIVKQKDEAIVRLQGQVTRSEEIIKDYENTLTTIKRKLAEKNSKEVIESSQLKDCVETVLEVGRKRCLENKPTAEEEPPTKKGDKRENWENYSLDLKRANNSDTYMEILALKEKTETLEGQMAALEEQCQREKKEKEELNQQIASLQLKLSASEERAVGLSGELQQCRAEYQETVSELDKQKTINKEQEEKIIQLNNDVRGAKQNIIDKVSQIKTMQSQVDELYKCHSESSAVDIDSVNLKDSLDPQRDEPQTAQMSPLSMQFQTASTADLRQESSFHHSIESIWEECKIMIKASSQKSHQIQQLLQRVEDLEKRLYDSENYNNQLKIKLNEITNQDHQSVKEKDLMNQLQEQIQKKTQDFENKAAEDQRVIAQFQEKVTSYEGKIRDLECLLEAFRAKDDSMRELEEKLKEKESTILNLESNTVALQEKCTSLDKKLKELSDREENLKDEVEQLMSSLETMKHVLQEKEKNEYEQIQSTELLRKDLSESSALVQSLKKDLQRKEEEYTDLKEKFYDAKKQIKQVQKEVCTMQTEEKSLRKQVNELEKIKQQFSEELEFKQRTILQLKKEQLNKEKLEEVSKQYEKTHKDLCAKEKIIADMRMTLEEQEQTQIEQDQVLEAKLEETNRLVLELEAWKQKYRELNNQCNSDWQQKMSKNEENTINENEELIKLQKELKENEAKYQTDRKKWLEEKMGLINQVKEAENHRNREMRKFVEDREHHVKQQAEIERLAAQLVEKDSNLQKWREERDELVEALEVQLKTLASSVIQKDKEIEELKQAALMASEKDKETDIEDLRKQLAEKDDFIKDMKQQIKHENLQSLAEVPLPEEGQVKIDQSVNKEDHSEIVLDSTEVSTEDGKTSRFPKPEMEIQFTPLQPHKMEVKHQGSTSPVTVKMLRPRRKRKSVEMNEDFVKSENKRNAKPAMADSPSASNKKMMSTTQSLGKEYPLRRQESTLSKKSAKKKDGTLQKIGDFFQSSPTIFHSKAKKLIETISSPKSAEPENVKENELKPKRAKRKLYSTDISCPLDIPGSSILVEQKKKESDHLIIKRRLRSRIAK